MLAMLGKGARKAGAGQPAEAGALAGTVAGRVVEGGCDNGPVPRR